MLIQTGSTRKLCATSPRIMLNPNANNDVNEFKGLPYRQHAPPAQTGTRDANSDGFHERRLDQPRCMEINVNTNKTLS